jgi:hypothetical protein
MACRARHHVVLWCAGLLCLLHLLWLPAGSWQWRGGSGVTGALLLLPPPLASPAALTCCLPGCHLVGAHDGGGSPIMMVVAHVVHVPPPSRGHLYVWLLSYMTMPYGNTPLQHHMVPYQLNLVTIPVTVVDAWLHTKACGQYSRRPPPGRMVPILSKSSTMPAHISWFQAIWTFQWMA